MTMTPPPTISGSHRRTYKSIFQHPITHNLEWRSVYGLLEKLGEVEEQPNGNLRATYNGHVIVLNPPRTKDVAEEDEVIALRHFIEQSERTPPETGIHNVHSLLVIDHQQARIFRSETHGSVSQQILPPDPGDYFRQAPNALSFTRGLEKPNPNAFFEPIASALGSPDSILIFGTGTGMSSEMDQFTAWLKTNHPELAARIVGSVVVDENHLTEAQLLAKAREFYANRSKGVS